MSSNCTSTTAVAVAPLSASKTKTKKKHFVCQKVKLFRASEPILSVLMWGVNHTVTSFPVRAPTPSGLATLAPRVTPATLPPSHLHARPPVHAVRPGVHSPFATRGLVSPCYAVVVSPSLQPLWLLVSVCWLRATPELPREGLGAATTLLLPSACLLHGYSACLL